MMSLQLDNQPCENDVQLCSGQPHASGEYYTLRRYPYGRVEARLKAVSESGTVTSLFTYTGPEPHDEIDIEILGQETTWVEFNYYVDGSGGHEHREPLGFDAAEAFHNYAFEWSSSGITWFVDGQPVYSVTGATAELPSNPGHIMVNLWCGTDDVSGWLGLFRYSGTPLHASYDWISYQPDPEVILYDGFESGDTTRWSASIP